MGLIPGRRFERTDYPHADVRGQQVAVLFDRDWRVVLRAADDERQAAFDGVLAANATRALQPVYDKLRDRAADFNAQVQDRAPRLVIPS